MITYYHHEVKLNFEVITRSEVKSTNADFLDNLRRKFGIGRTKPGFRTRKYGGLDKQNKDIGRAHPQRDFNFYTSNFDRRSRQEVENFGDQLNCV